MNKTISIGNLTDEPEISETQSGKKVARFNLALNRTGEGADFPNFIAWEQKAELLEKYCHKGMKIAVEGHIQTGSYEGKNGKVYTTDVIADRIEFLEKKKDEQPKENPSDEFMKIPDGIDEELPFA